MMSDQTWRQGKLQDLVTLQRGFDITKAQQVEGVYPVISSSGVKSYHSEYKVNGPGLVIGRKGTLGTVFYSASDFWPHDTTLWVKDFHSNNHRYCYYFLKSMGFEQYDVGAANPTLNRNHIHGLPIRIPTPAIQCRIASILSTYDDLIENNTRRIEILEEMTRRIYEEWFVHFRFPGHEEVRFKESELGKIPEVWEVVQLGDALEYIASGKRPRGGVGSIFEGVASVGAENVKKLGFHDYAKEKHVPREFFEKMNKGVVKDGDIALYKDGAYIGRSTYFRDGFPHLEFCVNEHIFLLKSADCRLTQNLLYLWIQQSGTVSAIRSTNANAAQPGINQKGVKGLKLTLPSPEITKDFDLLVEPLMAQITSLAKKNNILSTQRDLLLPKLVSGEIDVSDIPMPNDKEVEAA